MNTHLYLDSGDPSHTRDLLQHNVLLAGQTTNPSLVAKHPMVQARVQAGELFTTEEINLLYKEIVQDISSLVNDSVSIEVYADFMTSAEEMITQGREMNTWIDNAHIKLPTIHNGIQAAAVLVQEGIRVNMTLCFTQEQAAAVYSATAGAAPGQVLLSPFIGRYDDIGIDGMDCIRNIQKMFAAGDGHVKVLAASIRSQDHLLACYQSNVDIITAPYPILVDWMQNNFPLPETDFSYAPGLQSIPYQEIDLLAPWESFDLEHELVTKGVEAFVADWQGLLSTS